MSDRGKKRRLRPGDTPPRKEPERRENTGDSDAEEEQRLDAALDARSEEGPAHRIGEDPPRDAAIDLASDVERAEREARKARGQTGAPGSTPVAGGDIEEERRRHADDDAEIAAKRAIGHEIEDARVRPIVMVTLISTIAVAIAIVAIGGLVFFFVERAAVQGQPATGLAVPSPQPPEPRLQVNPPADWQALQATEQALLDGYGWTDQAAGRARIPIDRAMQLVIERGLPVRQGSNWEFGTRRDNLDSSGGQSEGDRLPPNAGPQPPEGTPEPTGTPTSGGQAP